MTQNLSHQAHVFGNLNQPRDRQARPQLRAQAESNLRDIAFVLKMTQRVREEIEAEQEIHEAVGV
jgi:hypothetical protein